MLYITIILEWSIAKRAGICVVSKMCVSTDEYQWMWGKHLILQLEITEKLCYYRPPPPTESRRLLEFTENFKFLPLPPPPPNRVGFWRPRKRLKKFNKLNLAALNKYFQWFVPNWRSNFFAPKHGPPCVIFFLSMLRACVVLNCLIWELWVRVKVLGSGCNNRSLTLTITLITTLTII